MAACVCTVGTIWINTSQSQMHLTVVSIRTESLSAPDVNSTGNNQQFDSSESGETYSLQEVFMN